MRTLILLCLLSMAYGTQATTTNVIPSIEIIASIDIDHTTKIVERQSGVDVIALVDGTLSITVIELSSGHNAYNFQEVVKTNDEISINLPPGSYEIRTVLGGQANIVQFTI